MSRYSFKSIQLVGGMALLAVLAAPAVGRAGMVNMGYDLFQTDSSGSSLYGTSLKGVPLVTYNFGGIIGNQNANFPHGSAPD